LGRGYSPRSKCFQLTPYFGSWLFSAIQIFAHSPLSRMQVFAHWLSCSSLCHGHGCPSLPPTWTCRGAAIGGASAPPPAATGRRWVGTPALLGRTHITRPSPTPPLSSPPLSYYYYFLQWSCWIWRNPHAFPIFVAVSEVLNSEDWWSLVPKSSDRCPHLISTPGLLTLVYHIIMMAYKPLKYF
jgi:hypothetical protein